MYDNHVINVHTRGRTLPRFKLYNYLSFSSRRLANYPDLTFEPRVNINMHCIMPVKTVRIYPAQRVVFTIGEPIPAVFDRVGGEEAAYGGVVVPVPEQLEPGRVALIPKRPAVAKATQERTRPHTQ